jgi:hypothetical protein
MHFHKVWNDAEGTLASIGGEFLHGSGFENEDPDTDFAADIVTMIPANPRED